MDLCCVEEVYEFVCENVLMRCVNYFMFVFVIDCVWEWVRFLEESCRASVVALASTRGCVD